MLSVHISQPAVAAPGAALTYLILLRFVLMVPITIVGLIVGAMRYGGVQRLLRTSS